MHIAQKLSLMSIMFMTNQYIVDSVKPHGFSCLMK